MSILKDNCDVTYRIILQSRHISLHCSLHVTCSHQSCCQIDVSVNKVWFQSESMAIMFNGLLQLPALLVDVPQVRVGLSQHWVLFDGQSAEVSRPVGLKW